MPTRHRLFDVSRLRLRPLAERVHDLDFARAGHPAATAPVPTASVRPALAQVAARLAAARASGAARVIMMGAHVLRSGVQPYLFDLLRRGFISQIAVNGACLIHDFELALIGATTESVARYIQHGQFGLWTETGRLNDIVARGNAEGLGLGEAVGREIAQGDYPRKGLSLAAAAWELGIPLTAHVAIGQDIVHQHPNFDGAAWGAASQRDFLIYAAGLEALEGGVVMDFGSAVMAPEVYLKALAMVRNVAAQEGREVRCFTSLVCDLLELPEDFRAEPPKDSAAYYFRPWKTMLVRTVQGGGEGFYCRARHVESIPELWTALAGLG
ncbi:MAG: hypothetical protein KKA55_07050 [Proteobacteria bacterium]|nr:hypothetical protein [Pseudomonadota bacterium]MBU1595276.1 hypothetical protein [Pseudomonadota bacterium]